MSWVTFFKPLAMSSCQCMSVFVVVGILAAGAVNVALLLLATICPSTWRGESLTPCASPRARALDFPRTLSDHA